MTLEKEINDIHNRLLELEVERDQLLKKLSSLETQIKNTEENNQRRNDFTQYEKIKLFRSLFKGREDIYPFRWENTKTGKAGYSIACANEWKKGLCNKPKIKCSNCTNQSFVPVSDEIIKKHLIGEITIGVYPMLHNETCWFLAIDFDKGDWEVEIKAFLATCKKLGIFAYVERSRSGNGGHIWIFFEEAIITSDARKLGSYILTETMEHYPEIGFQSYDRLFPNQDTMPIGGFGNLIALPLQYNPRQNKNSVFVDEHFIPYENQWNFLSSIQRVSRQQILNIVEEAIQRGRVIGVKIPVNEDSATEPWKIVPSRKSKISVAPEILPSSVDIVRGNQLYILKSNLPATLKTKFIRLAAFQNPEFYKAQAMRFPVFDKPRVIACAESYPQHIGIPRGCEDELNSLLKELDLPANYSDERNSGKPIRTKFLGVLNKEQKVAVKALVGHDIGTLSASTGFGKTVIASYIIAKRKRNTLILVHRKQLLDQWLERLQTFLNMDKVNIGQIGGGKNKPSKQVDIAIIQSLVHKGEVKDIVAEYGHVIVDECHHLSAISFESVAKACKAKYFLGLTATPCRKDGHHPIIFMQCGPIRYHVDAKKQAEKRPFQHLVIEKYTKFRLSQEVLEKYEKPPIHVVYAEIIRDVDRNEMIIEDVLKAISSGRSPVIITERREHIDYFVEHLKGRIKNIIVLHGGMSTKDRNLAMTTMKLLSENDERLLIATGSYLGEGFDDARLDTLFLTMPISWKGTLAQYAGRLHRIHHGKTDVRVYDYVDNLIPVLERMSNRRRSGYEALGYSITS